MPKRKAPNPGDKQGASSHRKKVLALLALAAAVQFNIMPNSLFTPEHAMEITAAASHPGLSQSNQSLVQQAIHDMHQHNPAWSSAQGGYDDDDDDDGSWGAAENAAASAGATAAHAQAQANSLAIALAQVDGDTTGGNTSHGRARLGDLQEEATLGSVIAATSPAQQATPGLAHAQRPIGARQPDSPARNTRSRSRNTRSRSRNTRSRSSNTPGAVPDSPARNTRSRPGLPPASPPATGAGAAPQPQLVGDALEEFQTQETVLFSSPANPYSSSIRFSSGPASSPANGPAPHMQMPCSSGGAPDSPARNTRSSARASMNQTDMDGQLALEMQLQEEEEHQQQLKDQMEDDYADSFSDVSDEEFMETISQACTQLSSVPGLDANDTPVDGKFGPICGIEGTPVGFERCGHSDKRLIEDKHTVQKTSPSGKYKMLGLRKGHCAGIPWVRRTCKQYIDHHMTQARRAEQTQKDGLKGLVNRLLHVVNKLLKWLMCEKDASPDDIYEMKSVIELMCSDVMEEYVEACFEAGYKASSLKTMEYTLSEFLLAMESLAAQHGLDTGDLLQVSDRLKKTCFQRGPAARKQAKESFTKEAQMQKLGITEQPCPKDILKIFKKTYKLASALQKKMEGLDGIEAILALTPEQHNQIQACIAVLISTAFGGARVTMVKQLALSWLTVRAIGASCEYYLDPSVDADLLKKQQWSELAKRHIHHKVGALIKAYIEPFKELFEDNFDLLHNAETDKQLVLSNFDRQWRVFFKTKNKKFVRAIARIHEGMENGTMDKDGAIVALAEALHDVPQVDENFMHEALKYITVEKLKMFKDINQIYWRHLIAWMNYELWYTQAEKDFCGMDNPFKGKSWKAFVLQASADANNSPGIWEDRYAPEGTSRCTREQELARQQDDLSASDEDEDEDEARPGVGSSAAHAREAELQEAQEEEDREVEEEEEEEEEDDDDDDEDQSYDGYNRKKGKKRARHNDRN